MKTIISFALILSAATFVAAQTPAATPAKTFPPRHRKHRVPKPPVSAVPNSATPRSPDFFVGEAKVDVTKDETVVRLAMAQHGSVLIELPANDGPRYIIPGDPEIATVDEKALERNKRAIVVRPGTQFVASPRNSKIRSPAATVTAQMRSGLVVTFLFYPVSDLAQNVHRCVLNYNRDEVVARRRAAGLPVNLDDKEQGGEKTTAQSAAAPIEVEQSKNNKPESPATSDRTASPSTSETKPKESVVGPTPDHKSEFIASLRSALDRASKEPKQFKNWTRSTRGLKLSILQQSNSEKPFNIVTIAVKNTTSATLELVTDSPELFIETVDEHGAIVNARSLPRMQTESSNTSRDIAPGKVSYFAIGYVSPVLGAHQRLKVVVAQTSAADEPASITLTSRGR